MSGRTQEAGATTRGPVVEPDIVDLARALLGGDVSVARCLGGRNSRVFRVDNAAGTFALKLYPDDGRARAQREFSATTFLAQAGVSRVPRPVAINDAHNVAAYTWLDGEPVDHVTTRDVDLLASFAAELHASRTRVAAREIRDAAEACFDEHAVLGQIQTRFDRLAGVAHQPLLDTFLRAHFAPVFRRERARVLGLKVAAPVRTRLTLSPSDFGFHNALRTGAAQIAFLDFEYFGWDDPVKLVADVCWHPGMALGKDLRAEFVGRCIAVYRNDASFQERLDAAFALYGLRWCLIVLNEFLPLFWARRRAAGFVRLDGAVLRDQLEKAYRILGRVVARIEAHSW